MLGKPHLPGASVHPRAVVGVVGVLLQAACYAVTPVAAPKDYIAQEPPSVQVTHGDTLLVVERPQLLGDTIVGFVAGAYLELPLASIREVRARQFAAGRTVALVGAVIVGLGLLVLAMRRRRPRAAPGAAT